ncbi:UDP-N-acetylglucosamine 1-carboxyvinyltransferase (plasmid) [Streptomyces sp. BI20]|uniref:UDP-N-acetylglucosamine 1-carboxyvinyltransferase n=1 Tax=Streptomyces sp. BI20 TaxID=3403460 RepID=UPI003C784662
MSAALRRTAMDVIAVRPGPPLTGVVTVGGAPGSAAALIATAAAAMRPVQISAVPETSDIALLLALVEGMGTPVTRPLGRPEQVTVLEPQGVHALDHAVAERVRAAVLLVPALLARRGAARLPWPGQARLDMRGLEAQFRMYEAFGDSVTVDDTQFVVKGGSGRGRVRHRLVVPSRGATITAMLRALVAARPLSLEGAHLAQGSRVVVHALRSLGWSVQVSGNTVKMAPPLAPPLALSPWTVPGDQAEAAAVAAAVAVTGGSTRIDALSEHDAASLQSVIAPLGAIAVYRAGSLFVDAVGQPPASGPGTSLTAGVDGVDSSLIPLLTVMAFGVPGRHFVADALRPEPLQALLPHLLRMGASIRRTSDSEFHFDGPQRLVGASVEATDSITSAALLIAGLRAKGVTTIAEPGRVRHGLATLPSKLAALGADIVTITP